MVRVSFQHFGALVLVVLLPVSSAQAQAADVTCYIDSVAGDDGKSGLSEEEARQDWTAIPSTCTIVKYKRGSVFNLASGDTLFPPKKAGTSGGGMGTSKIKTVTNYGDASLPQPKFIKERQPNNGGMVSAYQGNLTIDGIHMEGAQSDPQMRNLAQGICIMAGSNTKILNNEIANCDIGMMLSGTGSLVQGNYVHDLHVVVDAAPGVDPNVVGGAEGIFVNGSNNEVAYNSFIDCSDYAEWTGGDCDGGATEVAVGGSGGPTGGGEVTGLKIHHNLAINTCGFFEVSSMGNLAGGGGGVVDGGSAPKGTFSNSTFYNNLIIDSGWLSLLQVNNTDLVNIKWENNTLIQRPGSVNAGIIAVVFTATSSGMTGGQLMPDTVFWTNNLFVFDGVMKPTPDKNFVQTTNIITTSDPGFVNINGSTPQDFALAQGSQAIDQGTVLPEITLDFLNNTVPDPSGKPDIGAFEYNSTEVSTPPTFPGPIGGSHGNTIGKGGAGGSGGRTGAGGSTGGTVARGTGGRPGGSGGAVGTGGSSSAVSGSGGASGPAQGSGGAGSGGAPGESGGAPGESGGAQGSGGIVGPTSTSSSGCTCEVGHRQDPPLLWLAALLGFASLARRRARR
jgi:hypothetical protein